MKFEVIYGETFEVIKPRKRQVTEVYPVMYGCTDIYQAYERPSIAKVQIWEYWRNFGLPKDENEKYIIGVPFISSHNCQAFTVTANVYDKHYNFVGVMAITRDHNRLYLA